MSENQSVVLFMGCLSSLMAIVIAFLVYPWMFAKGASLPAAQAFLTFALILNTSICLGMHVIAPTKYRGLSSGVVLFVAASCWFLAPAKFFAEWAINPVLIGNTVKFLFTHWTLERVDHAVIVFNLLWFLVLAVAVALVRTSRFWGDMARMDRRSDNKRAVTPGALPKAEFESESKIKAYFNEPGGIVIGELTSPYEAGLDFNERDMATWNKQGEGELLTMSPKDGNGHVLVISESGGFKTTGIMIPNLINYSGPVVAFDPKMDLYERCAPMRQRKGFETILVDEQHGLDPLSILAPLIEKRHSLLVYVAKALITDGGEGRGEVSYFVERARDLFVALLYKYLINDKSDTALLDIMSFLAQDYKTVQKSCSEFAVIKLPTFAENGLKRVQAVEEKYWESIPRMIANSLYFAEFEEASSIVTNIKGSDRHRRVLDPKTDVFFNVSSELQRSFAQLLRLATTAMLTGAKETQTPEQPTCHRLFLIDEAKNLGNMDVLELVRDEGRAYGLHLMLFYQSYGQMVKIWGSNEAVAAWEDSISVQIIGAAQSDAMSERIARKLGKTTLEVTSDSSSTSSQYMDPMRGQTSKGTQVSSREVFLFNPQNVQQLPRQGSIIFSRKCKPFLATKAIYYTRSDMWNSVSAPFGGEAKDPSLRSLGGRLKRRWAR